MKKAQLDASRAKSDMLQAQPFGNREKSDQAKANLNSAKNDMQKAKNELSESKQKPLPSIT